MMYLLVWRALRIKDGEWTRIYERLVPIKCSYDERTRRYVGRGKVIGRIAGQMISVMYALLKKDQETLSNVTPGARPPEPVLYDPEVHRRHREGQYRAATSGQKRPRIIQLPAQ